MKSEGNIKSISVANGRPTADTVRFHYVYILKCNNNLPYVGCTDDLRDRIKRHEKGSVPATKGLRPLKLINYFALSNKYVAFSFEKYLKSGSGRAFMKKHKLLGE